MIKPGKVRSQPMKANYTGENDINVVRKYFRLTLVFNGLKTSLNLCFSSSIALEIFLIFELEECLTLNTLKGRQSSLNLSRMHHWVPFHQLSSRPHAKDKHGEKQA
jgi:hypothetical protein